MSDPAPSPSLSLTTRLLLAASLVLVAALGVTGLILDAAYRASATAAVQDRLQGHIYTLLAAANLDADGNLFVPDSIPEPRFSRPGSGLYAHIDGDGFEWSSPSAMGETMNWPERRLEPAEQRFDGPISLGDAEAFVMQLGIAWETEALERRFTINAAETTTAYLQEVAAFRRTLWTWLVGVAVILLAVQGGVLRWSLQPLRSVSRALGRVERGEARLIDGRYPTELHGLTEHLNRFIRRERKTLKRYRNSLADLAHSLKTPLAVLRSNAEKSQQGEETLDQVARMDDIVAYQLQRASTSGHLTFSKPIDVLPVAEEIVGSLEKVHAAKNVVCQFDMAHPTDFFGDKGDLMELLGNLCENAFKWCTQHVVVGADNSAGDNATGCRLWVEDDGPGIDSNQANQLLQRGVRGDERVQGHGIGLAIVSDIVAAYEGSINVERGALGGAKIVLTFPGVSTQRD